MTDRCETCRHWRKSKFDESGYSGFCKREIAGARYPQAMASDWCDKYETQGGGGAA